MIDEPDLTNRPTSDIDNADSEGTEKSPEELIAFLKDLIKEIRAIQTRYVAYLRAHPELFDYNYIVRVANLTRKEKSENNNIQFLSSLQKELIEFFRAITAEQYESILKKHLNIDNNHFAHNIGKLQIFSFMMRINQLLRGVPNRNLQICLSNFEYLLEQTICHLQSFINTLNRAIGANKKERQLSNAIQALVIAVRSRLFFGPLHIKDDDVISRGGDPEALIRGNEGIQVPLELSDLVEVLYPPISNATKSLVSAQSDGVDPSTLVLDTNVRQVEYNGKSFVVFEIFNSGKLIDIQSIHKEMAKLSQNVLEILPPRTAKIIEAVQSGSRQANLMTFDPSEILFLNGFTLGNEGQGIGLHDMQKHLDLLGGAVMLNNVYGSTPREAGVCTTIILPSSDFVGEPKELRKALLTLKKLLQSGKYILPEIDRVAA